MSSEIAIRVQNISKCYQIYNAPRDRLKQFVVPRLQRMAGQTPRQYFREFWALKDISFEVKKGETVGIIGRNGSGKSTLLQMICGTLSPTGGSVETNGRIAALLELGSGFNPEFTGRENVYMNAAVLGLGKKEVDERFDDIAAFADIGQFIEQPVKTYSSGMVVRLAFAVQAMIDPDIFVVDEALAVGDEKFQRKCFVRLEELKSRGSAILFVSHSAGHITELCDKVLFLDHGERLMYSIAPETIRAYQKLIYAPVEEQQRLVQEYRAADQSGKRIENNVEGGSITISYEHLSNDFDPGLVPQTTEAYSVQGAEIESIQIFDAKGRAVNVLQPGGDYQFVVSGRFLNSLAGVCFGISIKSTSGVIITGQRYPEEGIFIEQIEAGKSFKITYGFRMDVLPGTYFVGGGIWSSQQTILAHRVLDALMFRVIHNKKQHAFGYVDSSAGETKLEII
ncbi:MAG: lipopolysaccharide transport system ATP-binding protein [Candidatus Nitrotoga sp. MKT]|nr:MAG: lipopolysaccharide transport system ATP-binding protein [Candidatus Nitrotoga sp. MKT]